jgi:outer membrane protein OmpA-like peptidoglycan-associated protein
MIGSWRSLAGESGPWGAVPAWLVAGLLAGVLTGCSLFGGQDKLPEGRAAYPNLGTVPTQAPPVSSSAERQRIAAGLIADRDNAAYSNQALTAQPAQVGSVAPPAPATVTPAAPAPLQPAQAEPSKQMVAAAAPVSAAPAAQPQASMQPPQPEPAPSQTTVSSLQPANGVTPTAPSPSPAPAAESPGAESPAAQPSAAAGGSYANAGAPMVLDANAPAAGQAQGAAAGNGQPIALIYFRDSSTSLSGHDLTVLHDVYLIQQQQGGRIRLVGHASQSSGGGNPAEQSQLNYRLSLARADAVAQALLNMGASRSALTVAAAGSADPAYAETTQAGEAGNRRVDVFLDR